MLRTSGKDFIRILGCTKSDCDRRESKLNFDEGPPAMEVAKKEERSNSKKGCSSPMCWFRPGKREGLEPPESVISSRQQKSEARDEKGCNSPMCIFRAGRKRQLKHRPMENFNLQSMSRKKRKMQFATRGVKSMLGMERGVKIPSTDDQSILAEQPGAGNGDLTSAPGKEHNSEIANMKLSSLLEKEQEMEMKIKDIKRILNNIKRSFKEEGKKKIKKKVKCSSPMCWFRAGRGIATNKRAKYDKQALHLSDETEASRKRDFKKRFAQPVERKVPNEDLEVEEDQKNAVVGNGGDFEWPRSTRESKIFYFPLRRMII